MVAEVSVDSDATNEGRATLTQSPSEMIGDQRLRLDELGRILLVDGIEVSLTRREFDVLAYLVRHQGVAVSRGKLMAAVWHERYVRGDRTVDVHIRRIRVKLGAHCDRVSTLRGFGYRFD